MFLSDAIALPFEDNMFDTLLTTYVLRVAPDPFSVMKEASRVAKNNATFVILDQFEGNWFVRLLVPFKLVLGWGKEYSINDLIAGTPWKVVSVKRIGKMMDTQVVVLKKST